MKSSEPGDEEGDYDAGKKRPDEKGHIAVGTLGLVLAVVVHAACIQDQMSDRQLILNLS